MRSWVAFVLIVRCLCREKCVILCISGGVAMQHHSMTSFLHSSAQHLHSLCIVTTQHIHVPTSIYPSLVVPAEKLSHICIYKELSPLLFFIIHLQISCRGVTHYRATHIVIILYTVYYYFYIHKQLFIVHYPNPHSAIIKLPHRSPT